jgi:hypothetical protein
MQRPAQRLPGTVPGGFVRTAGTNDGAIRSLPWKTLWSPALSGAEAEMSRYVVVQLRLERTPCQQNITLANRMSGSWRCNSDEIRPPLRQCC